MPAMMKKSAPPPTAKTRPSPPTPRRRAGGPPQDGRRPARRDPGRVGAVVPGRGRQPRGETRRRGEGLPPLRVAPAHPEGDIRRRRPVRVRGAARRRATPRVVAEAEGYALGGASQGFAVGDFQAGPPDDGRDLTVKLTADQPVEGRLVDLEGRPIAGATVRSNSSSSRSKATSSPISAPSEAGGPAGPAPEQVSLALGLRLAPPGGHRRHVAPGTTDAQGRFVLKGVGRDRLIHLKVEAPAIRPLDIEVITGRWSRSG